MKHRIIDTTRLEESEERRVVLRQTSTGLLTLEMDMLTLKELGIPVAITGSRWSRDILVSVQNGFSWDSDGKREKIIEVI